jgi:hypothetical protein
MMIMANGQGGMRRPQNPAPVSGPGQLSQRTDGGPQQVLSDVSGLAYGENQGMEDLQSAAPMSASGQATARATRRGGAGRAAQRAAGQPMVPLMSPTQRPDEPVTAGAPFGPGPGPMGNQQVPPRLSGILQRMAASDPSGDTEALLAIAQRLGY